jgi:hypothetical protein
VHLEEGAVTLNQAYSLVAPVQAQIWTGVTMAGELDALELRDAAGHSLPSRPAVKAELVA